MVVTRQPLLGRKSEVYASVLRAALATATTYNDLTQGFQIFFMLSNHFLITSSNPSYFVSPLQMS